MANIALGIDFFGEEIDVKFENETKYINPQTGELVSTIPELLNKGEQQEYKRYDELKLYLELNASLENSLEEGRLAINDILALFPAIGGIESAVRFTEGHSLLVELSGTIGIDFAKLLSDDLADIDDALRGEINLTYYILDYENEGSPEEFEQVILNVWIIGTDIYIQAEVFDSHLNLHIPDMQLTRMLLNLAGLSEEEGDINPFNSAVYNALPEYKEYKEQQGERIENPFEALYNASNEGFAGNILEAFVRINSQEAGIILTWRLCPSVYAFDESRYATNSSR